MQNQTKSIAYDFHAGEISNTTTSESLGMALMRLAAKATRGIDFTGLSHANRLISRILPSDRHIQARMFEDTLFEFPYGDGYWGCLLDNTITYSPAEESFLMALHDVDYAFIDCGANFGYMSSIVTSKLYGGKPAIAIEADPNTFNILERNWNLNDQRFELRNNAVFSKSGEIVEFGGGKHEARSILDGANDPESNAIETISLDSLIPWIKKQKKKHLVLKLDVEGVEIDALKGAERLLKSDPCIMYEDHANDKTHEVSHYMKEELGMQLFLSTENGCREIRSYDDISAVKTNPRVGYDFIAVRGGYWPDLVANIRYD